MGTKAGLYVKAPTLSESGPGRYFAWDRKAYLASTLAASIARWTWRRRHILVPVAIVLAVLSAGTASLGVLIVADLGFQVFAQKRRDVFPASTSWRCIGVEPFSLREWGRGYLRVRLVKRQWPKACAAAGLLDKQSKLPPLLAEATAEDGDTVFATVPTAHAGLLVHDLATRRHVLAEVTTATSVSVAEVARGLARVTWHWSSQFDRMLTVVDLPESDKDHLSYGVRRDGTAAAIRAQQSVIVAGMTRKGKSQAVHALITDAVRKGTPLQLYISDPKGGIELPAYRDRVGAGRAGLIEVCGYAATPSATEAMLKEVDEARQKRMEWMLENRVSEIRIDEENPLVVVILDETLALGKMLQNTDSPLERLGSQGAAAGFVVWLCSQVGQKTSMGTIRDLIPQRICFATGNRSSTDVVLGDQATAMGARCHEISQPFLGYSSSDGNTVPQAFRSVLVTREDIALIAQGRVPEAMTCRAQRCAVYTYFDWSGQLVTYIGKSVDPIRRHREHELRREPWVLRSNGRLPEIRWYPSEAEALRIEQWYIRRQHPIYNKIHAAGSVADRHRWQQMRRVKGRWRAFREHRPVRDSDMAA